MLKLAIFAEEAALGVEGVEASAILDGDDSSGILVYCIFHP